MRLLESAETQASELYKTALIYEDTPDARADLAISELGSNRLADAIADSERALAAEPHNLRAELVLARALERQGEYAKAADAYSRAVQLQPKIESLYSLGICLLATGEPKDKDRAAAVFQQMARTAGESGSLHVLFGRAYRDAGDMPSAVRELQEAIRLDTTTPHAHYFLGIARLSMNEWKPTPDAESELKAELQYHPGDFLANYMLGFLLSSDRQYEDSNRYLATAARLNGSWPEPWLYMGLNAYSQGDMKSAEEDMLKAIQLTGTDEARGNYQIRRAYVDLGRILSASGRKPESETYLTRARDLQNKIMRQTQAEVASMSAASGGGMAATVSPIDKQHESEQAPALRTADASAPGDAAAIADENLTPEQRQAADAQEKELRLILGQSYKDLATSEAIQGRYAQALAHYQAAEHWSQGPGSQGAASADPVTPDLAKNLGQSAFRANDYAEAIRGLSQALNEKPDDRPVRAMLGMSYFYTQRFGDAARVFLPLGEGGMSDPLVGYAWAASLAKAGDLKDASKVLVRFEAGAPSQDMLLLIGQLWTEIGDYSHAVETLHRALATDASLPRAHYYAGLADILWQHWPDAAAEFTAELLISPHDEEARYNLGFVALQQSKNDEAMRIFREVIAADPSHANAQYELGKMLLDRGQAEEAVPYLEAAARLDPGKDYLHYQLQAAYRKESRTADADRELEIYKELKAKSRPHIVQPSSASSSAGPSVAPSPGPTQ